MRAAWTCRRRAVLASSCGLVRDRICQHEQMRSQLTGCPVKSARGKAKTLDQTRAASYSIVSIRWEESSEGAPAIQIPACATLAVPKWGPSTQVSNQTINSQQIPQPKCPTLTSNQIAGKVSPLLLCRSAGRAQQRLPFLRIICD